MTDDKVQLPAKAVSNQDDILPPLRQLLQGLNLLGSPEDTESAGKAGAALSGPPQSVAVIEAGATALSKWWAAGLGVSVSGLWAAITTWWNSQDTPNQRVVIWAASIATAAAILAIGYIIGSDVRGRAAASVATVESRAKVANLMIQVCQSLFVPTPSTPEGKLVSLPAPLRVRYTSKPSNEELDWYAVALFSNGADSTKYLVAKGSAHEWVNVEQVELVGPPL